VTANAAAAGRPRRAVLPGSGLHVEVPASLAESLERWLPVTDATRAVPEDATIRVGIGPAADPPEALPTLYLAAVRGWVADERVALRGRSGAGGEIDLGARRADLTVPDSADPAAGWDLHAMLTLAAAFLLGRTGRALVHAAATVDPRGSAWLLAGDAWSGKTTTVATLIAAGWDWLSDDQVVLSGGSAAPLVEGWPRAFHLDDGWAGGAPSGRRSAADPRTLGPGRWQPAAPLGGVLLPRVEAGSSTRLDSIPPAEAFAGLVRQSPWLLADPLAAPAVLELLRAAALGRAHRLLLGRDSFRRPGVLVERLAPLVAA
jgi:hypothetical protein